MIHSSYEVEVLVNGKPLKEYVHNGKLYIEGRKDTKFSLRLRNNSAQRKLFIPSIDGLSVMDGKDASFDSSGYIVQPYSTLTIDGWRTSTKEVAEFFFSSPGESYGKKKGKGNNLGVVGVAVFGEKIKPQPAPYDLRDRLNKLLPRHVDWWRDDPFYDFINPQEFLGRSGLTSSYTTTSAGSDIKWEATSLNASSDGAVSLNYSNSEGVSQNFSNVGLGTGWGDQKRSEVTMVDFEREDSPRETFEIFYNTREQLELLGISLTKPPVYVSPQAFPGQFCEPPKN